MACSLDLDSYTLFREGASSIAPAVYRGVQTSNPRVVEVHKENLRRHIEYHKIDRKTGELYEKAKVSPEDPTIEEEFEKLDKLLTEGMLHAEKEVSRKISMTFHWSSALSFAVKSLHYWQLCLQCAKDHNGHTQRLLHNQL